MKRLRAKPFVLLLAFSGLAVPACTFRSSQDVARQAAAVLDADAAGKRL